MSTLGATTLQPSESHEHSVNTTGILSVCFLFITMLFGAIIIFVQTWKVTPYIFKAIHYTVFMFLIGFLIGALTSHTDSNDLFVRASVLFNNFPPELVWYLFIPPLIFGPVCNLNMHHFKSTFFQGLLLAGPVAIAISLVFGAVLATGVVLPYAVAWDANTMYLFAAVLCATDPVSILNLLSKMELFRSQKMKYIISHESLLNDATALVLYEIFLSGALIGQSFWTPYELFIYALKVVFVSPLVGLAFGFGSLLLMFSIAGDNYKEEYTVIKIVVPICCAYLSFFVGNFVLKGSGIISIYFAGKFMEFEYQANIIP